MRYKKIRNTISLSKDLLNRFVKEGDIVADATVGNGNDTLILSKLVGSRGMVYGFDIQEEAIARTRKLLEENNLLDRVYLIHDSHDKIDEYIQEPLDLIVYNLGYLPRGDKRIITRADSTLTSVSKALELLKENGIMLIVSYIGHPGGLEEKIALEEYLGRLDQGQFNVLRSEFLNQKNMPPLIYLIEKSSKE